MMPRQASELRRPAVFALAATLTLVASMAGAQPAPAPASAAAQGRLRLDPGMPPDAARAAARTERRSAPASTGSALNAEVEQQLRGSFDAADRTHRGLLTRAEAQAGGFGYVAQHFDAIDTRRAGEVSFDDVRRYLQLRGARYIAK